MKEINEIQIRPRQSLWLVLLTIAVSGLFLYLAARNVSWEEILTAFRTFQPEFLVILFLISSISIFFRGVRWGVLLSAKKIISPLIMFFSAAVGYLGNTFLPARAGELIRSVMLGKKEKINTGYVLATALTERVIDVIILVILGTLSILQMQNMPDWLTKSVSLMGGLGILAVFVLAIFPRMKNIFYSLIERVPIKEKWKIKVVALLDSFLEGSQSFLKPKNLAKFLGLSVIIWLLDASGLVLLAQGFQLDLTYPQALLFLTALGLSSAIPSTPGYVGIYQFVAVSLLPVFGFTTSQAFTFILTTQGVTTLAIVVWGLPAFFILRDSSSEFDLSDSDSA